MQMTVNGLVVRSRRTGDHDRLIYLLTEERGRVPVMVKGSTKENKAAVTQLFTYGNFELYAKKEGDLTWFRNAIMQDQAFAVTGDLPGLALSNYLCDLSCELIPEWNASPESAELLRMLRNALYVLAHKQKPLPLVKAVFELRAAALLGYQPDLTGCCECGNGYPEAAYLDIMNGCLICADCQTKRNRSTHVHALEELGERRIICPLTPSVLAALRYALAAPERKIFSFALTDQEEERDFARTAETYLLNQIEQDFVTLQFYHSVVD